MPEQIVYHVDNMDNEVRQVELHWAHQNGILHRSTLVMVFSGAHSNRVLLTQRGQKQSGEGKWQIALHRHVFPGESYETAAKKALEEQLFKEGTPDSLVLTGIGKFRHATRIQPRSHQQNHEMSGVFTTVYGRQFEPNAEMIHAIDWKYLDDVANDITEQPEKYTETSEKLVKAYLVHITGKNAFLPL